MSQREKLAEQVKQYQERLKRQIKAKEAIQKERKA